MEIRKKKFINIRPAVISSAGLILGIILAYCYLFYFRALSVCLFIIIIVGLTLLTCWFLVNKNTYYAVVCIICLFLFILGAFLLILKSTPQYFDSGTSSFEGVVKEIFTEQKFGGGYVYNVILNGNFLKNQNANVYVEFESENRLFIGSVINFNAEFLLLDTSMFTLNTNTFYTAIAETESIKIGEVSGVFENVKRNLFEVFYNTMPKTYGLNYALLTGDTCYVEESILTKYREIGIAHLFAVSGLHIGLMYLALSKIIKIIKLDEKPTYVVVLCLLFLYVWLCGFTASALRAFIIISIRNFTKIIGEKSDASTNIALSAIIVLTLNPSELLSVGFLLSFSVYSGLVLLTPSVTKTLSKFIDIRLSKVFAPCLVAQMVSFPILLDFFGYASLFSFIFNLFIIPFISFVYPFILASSILLLAFPSVWAFSVIPNLLFLILEFILSFVNTSIFLVKGIKFYYTSILYYAFLYTFTGKLNFKAKTLNVLRIILISLAILLFYIINIVVMY